MLLYFVYTLTPGSVCWRSLVVEIPSAIQSVKIGPAKRTDACFFWSNGACVFAQVEESRRKDIPRNRKPTVGKLFYLWKLLMIMSVYANSRMRARRKWMLLARRRV